MTRNHFYRFNNSHARTEYSGKNYITPCCFPLKVCKTLDFSTFHPTLPLFGWEEDLALFCVFCNVTCCQLCRLTHHQVQLSDKGWTAWGWVLHSLLFLETSIQPTQMLFTIVQWRVNPHLLSSSCSCCMKQNASHTFPFSSPHLFLLSYPNHMDAARMDG